MARTFNLSPNRQAGEFRSSDGIEMGPFRDGHWEDKQMLHETVGFGGTPQTSLQPLPANIPPNAELSHSVGGGPAGWGGESYFEENYGGAGGPGSRYPRSGGRRYYQRPLYDYQQPYFVVDRAASDLAEREREELDRMTLYLMFVIFILFLIIIMLGAALILRK